MVAMVATASSLAQFAGIYPSAGPFITYITRAVALIVCRCHNVPPRPAPVALRQRAA